MSAARLLALARALGRAAKRRGWQVVTAESCTGGGVASAITDVPGSSAWFGRGFVTYANEAKREMLGVREKTLQRFGAVSEEVAIEMAAGALKKSGAHASVAITGIAGPAGATPGKPVGLVWFAWARRDGVRTEERHFEGDRLEVRARAAEVALQGLIDAVKRA